MRGLAGMSYLGWLHCIEVWFFHKIFKIKPWPLMARVAGVRLINEFCCFLGDWYCQNWLNVTNLGDFLKGVELVSHCLNKRLTINCKDYLKRSNLTVFLISRRLGFNHKQNQKSTYPFVEWLVFMLFIHSWRMTY